MSIIGSIRFANAGASISGPQAQSTLCLLKCMGVLLCSQVDVEKPEDVRLVDLDETHSGEHTVFIMPPEEPQEADGSECPALYRYNGTLQIQKNLFKIWIQNSAVVFF